MNKIDWKQVFSFIGLSVLLTGVLVGVRLTQVQQELRSKAAPATSLALNTENIQLNVNQAFPVTVDINTGQNQAIIAEIYLTFDPQKLEATDITPGSFFTNPETSGKLINNTTGTIEYILHLPPGSSPQQGTGTLANVTFIAKSEGSTSISFIDKTMVGAVGETANAISSLTPLSVTIYQTSFSDTKLYLNTPNHYPEANQTIPVTIDIDTGVNQVVIAELYISFDPNLLQALDITPGNFFNDPVASGKVINNTTGTIEYVLHLPPGSIPQQGTGTLANISFNTTSPGNTTVRFTGDTLVGAVGERQDVVILRQNLLLYIRPAPSPTPTPTPSPTPTPTPTSTPTPTPTFTPRPTSTPTPRPTSTPQPTPTFTPRPTFTPEPTATPTPKPYPICDINLDWIVNALDYVLLFEHWGQAPPQLERADINGDGIVNSLDYVLLFEHFGEGT